jgi:hypothetical protein
MEENENGNGNGQQHEDFSSDEWKQRLRKDIDFLEKLKVTDRLEICAALGYLFYALNRSCQGWLKWLQAPVVMKEFKEEELKHYLDIAKKNIIELLELDFSATDKYYEAIKIAESHLGGKEEKSQLRYT